MSPHSLFSALALTGRFFCEVGFCVERKSAASYKHCLMSPNCANVTFVVEKTSLSWTSWWKL